MFCVSEFRVHLIFSASGNLRFTVSTTHEAAADTSLMWPSPRDLGRAEKPMWWFTGVDGDSRMRLEELRGVQRSRPISAFEVVDLSQG
jgi:hypothetical protein